MNESVISFDQKLIERARKNGTPQIIRVIIRREIMSKIGDKENANELMKHEEILLLSSDIFGIISGKIELDDFKKRLHGIIDTIKP